MTDQGWVEAPELIGIGAQSIVDRAQALGLTWQLRPVTVVGTQPPVTAVYDGDNAVLPFVNLTGMHMATGTRAMGMVVPPAGNYIIGFLDPGRHAPNCAGLNVLSAGTDNLLSTSYVNIAGGGVTSFSFTKEAVETRIKIDMSVTAQSFTTNAVVTFGVSINSVSYDIFQNYYPVLTRLPGSGSNIITTNLSRGTYTIQTQWKLRAAATVSRFANDDFMSCIATEVRA